MMDKQYQPGDKIKLNENCLKLDRANAKAIISGFDKGGRHLHQAIYCVVKERINPMLITLNRSTHLIYKLSKIGKELNQENFSMPFKYIAVPIKFYHVGIELSFWERICSNGLFDIWDAEEGPIKRYTDPKICNADPSKFMIVLFRIFEIEEQFMQNEIRHAGKMYDKITKENLFVTLKKPING